MPANQGGSVSSASLPGGDLRQAPPGDRSRRSRSSGRHPRHRVHGRHGPAALPDRGQPRPLLEWSPRHPRCRGHRGRRGARGRRMVVQPLEERGQLGQGSDLGGRRPPVTGWRRPPQYFSAAVFLKHAGFLARWHEPGQAPGSTAGSRRPGSGQRHPKIFQQVLGGLDADREPDQVGGTSSAEPATEACVIRPGCSISDSTPPSDSASVNSRVRPQMATASCSPPRARNDTMPPKPRICLAAASWPGWDGRPG